MSWSYWPSYTSVAELKENSAHTIKVLRKKGHQIDPVVIRGKSISQTFWGQAWCQMIESYSDDRNRLSKGRSYVRHGSVIDLKMSAGEIRALVCGSSLYEVSITINPVGSEKWTRLVEECSGKVLSLIELLQGKFSKSVMEIIASCENGLLPYPKDFKFHCDCYDYDAMCKHVIAVLYGVGHRLDDSPEDLFLMRDANHMELIERARELSFGIQEETQDSQLGEDLSSLFGIEIAETNASSETSSEESVAKPDSDRSQMRSSANDNRKA